MLIVVLLVLAAHNIWLQRQMDRTKLVIRALLEIMSEEDE